MIKIISSLELNDIACFNDGPEKLENISKINFIYGCNGTGKTTISRVIDKPEKYESCNLEWNNQNELKILVYNDDFIKENFLQSKKLKGVFTLGEDKKKIEKQISEEMDSKDEIEDNILKTQEQIEDKKDAIESIEESMADKCWLYKQEYEEYFSNSFSPNMGSRKDFKNKILEEERINNATLKGRDELIDTSNEIYKKDLELIDEIDLLTYEEITKIQNDNIFNEIIVGKQDVDIADIIEELGNSDWVKEGRKYLSKINDICPFCQQKIENNLKQSLEKYFDSTYENKLKKLESLKSKLKEEKNKLLDQIDSIIELDIDSDYIDIEKIKIQKKIIETNFQENIKVISEKLKNPSQKIVFNEVTDHIQAINQVIEKANNKIEEHNKLINNIEVQKEKLEKQVWKFILSKIKDDLSNYHEKKKNLNKAIKGLNKQLNSAKKSYNYLEKKIKKLESESKSIKPAYKQINETLNNFGYSNFKLKEADDKVGYYEIIRDNGEQAKETLSEGEVTLLTFLYFFELINGSLNKEENISQNKVIVIDDPVSSLDSNILFLVSTMIKDLIKNVHKDGQIKQIFVLTHNVYFHNQVTFDSGTNNYEDWNASFYVINKGINTSKLKYFDNNPIKSSYKLLWKEIKRIKNDEFVVSFQNVMRRIIEYYFDFLGNQEYSDLRKDFIGKKKQIYNSLISWINSGSHNIQDDLYVEMGTEQQKKYLEVFKEVFYKTGHDSHYDMMMGENS